MIRRNFVLLLLILLAAFGLRIFQLESQSIWWDEGISLHLASSDYGEIVQNRLDNIHPPLYFFALKTWINQAGLTAFSARYFSLLAGWLQVAAMIALARRWFSIKTALVAGILAAFSAVSIIYSQETRVYAFLPLIYLALLAITRELTRPKIRIGGGKTILWLLLGIAIWLGIHLHYITFFIVFYVTIWAFAVYFKNKDWICFKRWLLTLFLVFLFSIPWFFPLFNNWDNVSGEATVGTFLSQPVPLTFLVTQLWSFQLSGLANFASQNGAMIAILASASGIALLFLIRLVQKRTRKDALFLLLHWLVPLSSALVVWIVRSFSHPRYVAVFVPGFLLFSGYLIMPEQPFSSKFWQRVVKLFSTFVFLSILLICGWGLWLYFFDPQIAKDDVRGAARYLEEVAGEQDLILVPDTDWSLAFEYKGNAQIEMPQLDDIDGGWSHMTDVSRDKERIFLIDYEEGARDWQDKIPFSLAMAGIEVNQTFFEGLRVREYALTQSINSPMLREIYKNFAPLRLEGVWIEQDAASGSQLAVALNWSLAQDLSNPAHVSIRLRDEDGWALASEDTILHDVQGRPTSNWPVGESVTTYHLLSVPHATPPFAYELTLQVYTRQGDIIEAFDLLDEQGNPVGQESVVGFAHISNRPVDLDTLVQELPLPLLPEPLDLAPGIRLIAAGIFEETIPSGSTLNVHLIWQAAEDITDDIRPVLRLIQDDRILDVNDDTPSFNRYPTSMWSQGELIYERKPLVVPTDLSGEAIVELVVGQENFEVGKIVVEGFEHLFELPAIDHPLDQQFGSIARLRGFDLDRDELTQDETLQLKLIWQSTTDGSEIDYVVFTHLLADDDHIIGQHDSQPAQGERHTRGWVEDEIIIDLHNISVDEEYEGEARIELGIYDPASGQRLSLPDGSDHLILPVTISIDNE